MPTSEYTPTELIMIHQPLGLEDLGAVFNAEAPFRACRLCGALFQSPLDLEQLRMYKEHDGFPVKFFTDSKMFSIPIWHAYIELEDKALALRVEWEENHRKKHHMFDNRWDTFYKSGNAFTPEAAHALSPFGIFPTGNKTAEIVDAMATAPRAPINDAEGL